MLLLGEAGLVCAEWTQLKALRALSDHADLVSGQVQAAVQRVAHLRAAVAGAESLAKRKAEETAKLKTKNEAQRSTQYDMVRQSAKAWLQALDNQEFLAALNKVDRDYNERTASAFLRGLGLSPEQVSHMLDLMGKMMIAKMDANQAATADGLDPRSRAALVAETQQETVDEIKAYLGDANFAAYQQFNQEIGVRSIASSLQTSLSFSSTPLSDAQAQQLADAMYQALPAAQKANATGLGALEPTGVLPVPPVTKAELNAAQSVLSAPQLAALQSIYAGQQAMQAIRRMGGF
jgi:hypothetical protein